MMGDRIIQRPFTLFSRPSLIPHDETALRSARVGQRLHFLCRIILVPGVLTDNLIPVILPLVSPALDFPRVSEYYPLKQLCPGSPFRTSPTHCSSARRRVTAAEGEQGATPVCSARERERPPRPPFSHPSPTSYRIPTPTHQLDEASYSSTLSAATRPPLAVNRITLSS
jgi:hypothetical protein